MTPQLKWQSLGVTSTRRPKRFRTWASFSTFPSYTWFQFGSRPPRASKWQPMQSFAKIIYPHTREVVHTDSQWKLQCWPHHLTLDLTGVLHASLFRVGGRQNHQVSTSCSLSPKSPTFIPQSSQPKWQSLGATPDVAPNNSRAGMSFSSSRSHTWLQFARLFVVSRENHLHPYHRDCSHSHPKSQSLGVTPEVGLNNLRTWVSFSTYPSYLVAVREETAKDTNVTTFVVSRQKSSTRIPQRLLTLWIQVAIIGRTSDTTQGVIHVSLAYLVAVREETAKTTLCSLSPISYHSSCLHP